MEPDWEDIPIEMVERILKQMERTTPKNDEPGQRMIGKYRRLLAQAKRAQRDR